MTRLLKSAALLVTGVALAALFAGIGFGIDWVSRQLAGRVG